MARACGSYPQGPEFESQHRHQNIYQKIKGLSNRKAFNYKRIKNVRREDSSNDREV